MEPVAAATENYKQPPVRPAAFSLQRSLNALTGARFLAAFYVVLFHFALRPATEHHAPAFLTTFLANGDTGVLFFFILSGFILTYSYVGKIQTPSQLARFWQARFARLYPVYLLSLLLNWPFRGDMSVGVMTAVLTGTQTWNPQKQYLAQAWNFPAWTLSVEMFFYLCFPLLLPLCVRCGPVVRRMIVAVLLLMVCLGVQRLVPLPWVELPQLIAGILLALEFLRSPAKPSNVRIFLYAALAIIILCLTHDRWKPLVAVPYAGLIYELAIGGSLFARRLSVRWMVFLGGASYSIYLLQFPVRNWIRAAFARWNPAHASAGAWISPIVLIIVSSVVYHWYEEPLRRALKNGFARLPSLQGFR